MSDVPGRDDKYSVDYCVPGVVFIETGSIDQVISAAVLNFYPRDFPVPHHIVMSCSSRGVPC